MLFTKIYTKTMPSSSVLNCQLFLNEVLFCLCLGRVMIQQTPVTFHPPTLLRRDYERS
jgi:hypothetical protein